MADASGLQASALLSAKERMRYKVLSFTNPLFHLDLCPSSLSLFPWLTRTTNIFLYHIYNTIGPVASFYVTFVIATVNYINANAISALTPG